VALRENIIFNRAEYLRSYWAKHSHLQGFKLPLHVKTMTKDKRHPLLSDKLQSLCYF